MRCKDCSAPATIGARCDEHRQAHNARERARRHSRQRKRQCWVCGEKAVTGGRACARHQSYRAEMAASAGARA